MVEAFDLAYRTVSSIHEAREAAENDQTMTENVWLVAVADFADKVDAFADKVNADVAASNLDRVDGPLLLQAVLQWHRDWLWSGFRYHNNGQPRFADRSTRMACDMEGHGCTSTASATGAPVAIPACWPA